MCLKSHPKDHPFILQFSRYICLTSCLFFSYQAFLYPCSYLGSLSGGSKSIKVQTEAAVDLGKYLHFANSEVVDPNEIVNMVQIENFVKMLAKLGIGPSGQVSKLNITSQAQTFLIHR